MFSLPKITHKSEHLLYNDILSKLFGHLVFYLLGLLVLYIRSYGSYLFGHPVSVICTYLVVSPMNFFPQNDLVIIIDKKVTERPIDIYKINYRGLSVDLQGVLLSKLDLHFTGALKALIYMHI